MEEWCSPRSARKGTFFTQIQRFPLTRRHRAWHITWGEKSCEKSWIQHSSVTARRDLRKDPFLFFIFRNRRVCSWQFLEDTAPWATGANLRMACSVLPAPRPRAPRPQEPPAQDTHGTVLASQLSSKKGSCVFRLKLREKERKEKFTPKNKRSERPRGSSMSFLGKGKGL